MSKKRRNLIILLAVTVLLGGLLWLLVGLDTDETSYLYESDDDDDVSDSDTGILIDEEQEDLTKLVFSNENGSYTALLDSDDEVYFEELSAYPVNTSFMEYIWYGVAQLSYDSIITSSEAEDFDSSVYGLDEPSLTVSATFGENNYTFIAGIQVPGASDGVYYLLLEGDSNVYECAIDTSFFMGDSYFLSDDVFYFYDEDLESTTDIEIGDITLSGDAFSGSFVMKLNYESDQSSPFYGFDYVVTSPISWPVKSTSSALLVHELTYLTADEAIVREPTSAELAEYGFDSPTVTIKFTRNDEDCTLYIGEINQNYMYLMLKGLNVIYELDVDGVSILNNLSPDTMYAANAISISMAAISKITVQSDDVSKSISISREATGSSDDEDSAIYTYSISVGSEDKEYSTYVNLLKQINNSTIQNWNVTAPDGDAEVTLTIEYFDSFGREESVIKFVKYSDRNYAVVWDGYPTNTVSVTWLNQFLSNIEAF